MDMRNYRVFFRNAGLVLAGVMLFAACGKDDPKSTACEIVSFSVNGEEWMASDTNIIYIYPAGATGTSLRPVIVLSPGATVYPLADEARDFFVTRGVTYTVTAEDGVTTKTYVVKAIQAVLSGDTGDCEWTLAGAPGDYVLAISGDGDTGEYNATLYPSRHGIKTVIIRDGVTGIGRWIFRDYRDLASVVIPNSVTMIGHSAFARCARLTSVTIPNSVTTIDDFAFNVSGLFDLTIGNSVTTIGAYAFGACRGLFDVTIPASVTEIGEYAFTECIYLKTVVNLNPAPQEIDDTVFFKIDLNACTLKVPKGAVGAYKAAPVWKEFKSIVGI
jgi:hypothetical protein